MKQESNRQKREREAREQKEAEALSRRKFIWRTSGAIGGALLAGMGVKSWVDRDDKSAPKIDPNTVKLAADSTVESLLRELIGRGHKKIFFADGNHADLENNIFFTKSCLPAFRKLIPQDKTAYVMVEGAKGSKGRLFNNINSASSDQERFRLIEENRKYSLFTDLHKERGDYPLFIKTDIEFFQALAAPGIKPLFVDTENDIVNVVDENTNKMNQAVDRLKLLEKQGKSNTPEYRKTQEEYHSYGRKRLEKANPLWVKEIKKEARGEYVTGFAGEKHLEGNIGVDEPFNAPVILIKTYKGRIAPTKIILGDSKDRDFVIILPEIRAIQIHQQAMSEITRLSAYSTQQATFELGAFITQLLTDHSKYNFSEELRSLVNDTIIPFMEKIRNGAPDAPTARAWNAEFLTIDNNFRDMFPQSKINEDGFLNAASAAFDAMKMKLYSEVGQTSVPGQPAKQWQSTIPKPGSGMHR